MFNLVRSSAGFFALLCVLDKVAHLMHVSNRKKAPANAQLSNHKVIYLHSAPWRKQDFESTRLPPACPGIDFGFGSICELSVPLNLI